MRWPHWAVYPSGIRRAIPAFARCRGECEFHPGSGVRYRTHKATLDVEAPEAPVCKSPHKGEPRNG